MFSFYTHFDSVESKMSLILLVIAKNRQLYNELQQLEYFTLNCLPGNSNW